jgi:very-short-patch-repair endonuclease
MSLPEILFWQAVKDDQLGSRVRRQVAKGRYFLDFYIAKYRLAVEIDGDQSHFFRGEYDAERDAFLATMHIRVLRIQASSVLSDIDAVMRFVRYKLDEFESEDSESS